MPTTKATQRLKDTINQSKNRKITQPTQFTTPSTPVTSSVKTYNPDYPWFSEEDYRKLESDVERMGITGANKKAAMNQLYRDRIKYVRNNQLLDERAKLINEQAYHAAELDDEQADAQLRMTEFSQALKKKYNLDATANDLELFKDYIAWLWEGWADIAWQYLSWQNKKLRYDAGLKTFGEKAEEFAVWAAQSPWKRGYNLIWQWMDKLWKAAADKLEWTKLAEWVRDKAIDAFWEDEVRAFAEQRQKELAEGTAFNGREATDIRTPILWEERANSKNVKAWEIVWDIGTAIALTYPLWSALAPVIAGSTTTTAGLLWAGWWILDTTLSHIGTQWDFDVTPKELLIWAVTWGLWGVATNKLSNIPRETITNTADKLDDAANASKAATTTSKIADKTDDANRIAGRIWQWDIDDQAKVVKGVKSITDRMWKDSVKSIKTYDQLDDAIRSTEKQIISQEDELLKQFPDKITDWTTTETVKWLWDQVDDVTRDYIDEGIELLKKYNKNDPAAMRELDMMQATKNTDWLTRLEAKNIARRLTSKLSKKFYNSNDELRNSMSAESYEKIRKGIQNAVRDRLPDDTLRNLDLEYSNLKAFEWLTDDMTEKVNTLTQKLKNMWPFEKLGRKVGDAINFVTGKGIKWLVEKFLPSNMWNKINNSIDMETELVSNLSKLVKLNGSIDELNVVLNNSATKSAIATALRKFANVVSEIKPITINTAVRWAETAANDIYNSTLDK